MMKELAKSGMTMIVITHEMGFAREVADSFVSIDSGVVVGVRQTERGAHEPAAQAHPGVPLQGPLTRLATST